MALRQGGSNIARRVCVALRQGGSNFMLPSSVMIVTDDSSSASLSGSGPGVFFSVGLTLVALPLACDVPV